MAGVTTEKMPNRWAFGEGKPTVETVCRRPRDSVSRMRILRSVFRAMARRGVRIAVVLCASCATNGESPVAVPADDRPSGPARGPVSGPEVTSLRVWTDTQSAFVGMRRRIQLQARVGNQIAATADAFVSIEGSATIALVETMQYDLRDINGRVTAQQTPVIALLTPGTVTVRATLPGITDSVVFTVHPTPPPTTAMVVDSFAVLEYRERCGGSCNYVIYAPLLKLREPTGVQSVDVVSVEFTIPGARTGMCRGDRGFPAGTSLHLNGLFPYLWSNDLIFARIDGTSAPEGDATAEVFVRDAHGVYGRLFVTGPIVRNLVDPTLPRPVWPDLGWDC